MPLGAAGRLPMSDPSQVRNRGEVKAWTEVPDQPYLAGRARELPGGEAVWCVPTLRWWDTLRTMPHCQLWGEGDWAFAETTALIHQALWTGEDPKAATELARRERFLGFTYEARAGMRIRYTEPPAQPGGGAALAAVTDIGGGQRQRPRPVDPNGSAQ